mmetsp:Transcript_20019/g.55617  ORF Transcript_20019/g.55617 Transcript_20019/m.55617 type:complete len:198 (+) Transcript_20019:588-1181(+)
MASGDLAAARLVLQPVALRVVHHLLDLRAAQAATVVGDGDVAAHAGGLLRGADRQDAVGVDVKGHNYLRLAPGHGRQPRKLKLAQQVVVLGLRPLALKHHYVHSVLVVGVRGEHPLLAGGQRCVAGDDLAHDAARRLHAEAKGGHIQQHQVLHGRRGLRPLGGQHRRLHRRPVRHGLIRVDATRQLLALEKLRQQLL